MTDIGTGFESITNQIVDTLTPLINEDKIKEIIVGEKTRGIPEFPHLLLILEDLTTNTVTMGSTGNREEWIHPFKIAAIVKETEDPLRGFQDAMHIIAEARTKILTQRQLGIPHIIRKVDSNQIQIVPYPFGKKKSLFGAGATFNIHLTLNNVRG